MYHVVTFVNNNTCFNSILSILSLNFILPCTPNEFWLESRSCNIGSVYQLAFSFDISCISLEIWSECTIDHSICIQLYVVVWKNSKGWSILVTYFTCHGTSNKNKCVKISESIYHFNLFIVKKTLWLYSINLNVVRTRTVALTHCSFISICINKTFFYVIRISYSLLKDTDMK